jgi:hypothetical protein
MIEQIDIKRHNSEEIDRYRYFSHQTDTDQILISQKNNEPAKAPFSRPDRDEFPQTPNAKENKIELQGKKPEFGLRVAVFYGAKL